MTSFAAHRLITSAFVVFAIPTAHAQTLYEFGNPTAEEQAYLELINRARANPAAEGQRLATTTDPDVLSAIDFFSVNLTLMRSEFNAISPAPPLAPNGKLTQAARGHSQWMFNTGIQSHNQTNPDKDLVARINEVGYAWNSLGENIYASSRNPWHGHAGFQIDWGNNPDGMQPGRGHRMNVHSPNFREVGIGIINGSANGVGPQLITQDFARQQNTTSFGTGVAYYDLNGNDFYDVGEGIPNVSVTVSGASHYCTTAVGGGWAVPIPLTAATRPVLFLHGGVTHMRTLQVPANQNAKVDLRLPYSPPSITTHSIGVGGSPLPVSISPIFGATAYRWDRWSLTPAPIESCDTLANVSTSGSPNAQVNTTVKHEGTGAFQLTNPGTIGTRFIEMNSTFLGNADSSVSFFSRLRTSTNSESFNVQVKEEGTSTWINVDQQTGGTAEPAFTQRNILLSSMAGKRFKIRFALVFPEGSYSPNPGNSHGWFIDQISFTSTEVTSAAGTQTLTGTTGSFIPNPGRYLMEFSPVMSGNLFPASSRIIRMLQAPVTYQTWAAAEEEVHSLPTGTLMNHPDSDFDGDGYSNLLEYAFGSSLTLPDTNPPAMPVIVPTEGKLAIRYTRNTSRSDLTYIAETSDDLVTWHRAGSLSAPAQFVDSPVSTNGNEQIREASLPQTGAKRFIRIAVSKP